jgi:hypothetical protein
MKTLKITAPTTLREAQRRHLGGKVIQPAVSAVADVSVYFDDLAEYICDEIKKHDVVVGCVAWLTHKKILRALAEKKDVSFVVTKDDFLRPEPGWEDRPDELRHFYEALPAMDKFACPPPINDLGWGSNHLDPVRCVGTKAGMWSLRCHHKFAVFGHWENDAISPRSVWTGSFNWSNSACKSLENGVLIRNEVVASAYLQEWVNAIVISESLDWEHKYVAPEWRVGES